MKINITKAHGTQNHFLIIENKENDSRLHQQEYIKKICKYKSNERIDGVLILSDNHLDYKMDYYNKDGTWETICANGARCTGLYMFNHYHKKIMQFEAGDGIHHIEILDNSEEEITCAVLEMLDILDGKKINEEFLNKNKKIKKELDSINNQGYEFPLKAMAYLPLNFLNKYCN